MIFNLQAAYFDHVKVAKKGFAKLFDAQAKEEHEHFEKFLNYINLRGSYVSNFNVKVSLPCTTHWSFNKFYCSDAQQVLVG